MTFKNPTAIKIGQRTTYGGLAWQVLGRVVLGVVEEGETYYWNEFNLASETGETATLVFERTEDGPAWRWFTQFQPQYPLTAADAATKEVGDQLNLEGTDVRVTLVETSRIYFIEGQAAEGERVGSKATYFNAEHGDQMIVVSWTGDEVEYYRGQTIPARAVREAFNLTTLEPPSAASAMAGFDDSGGGGFSWSEFLPKALLILTAVVLILWLGERFFLRPGTGITRITAPPSPLALGATGRLADVNYRITGHALLEVSEVNLRFEHHEYYLRDDQDNEAVLLADFHPGDHGWVLFTPLHPMYAMTPYQAGAVRLGEAVNVGGLAASVDELFITTVRAAEFAGPPETAVGETYYGFAGNHDDLLLMASWNANGISFWKGRRLTAHGVLQALGPITSSK